MIAFNNIKVYKDVPFDDYLKIEGKSHSSLKSLDQYGLSKIFVETDKVRIGKLVDAILTDPASVDMRSPLYATAKVIAAHIRNVFGSMIDHFQMQLSYTADLEHNGLVMPAKFRLDWLLPGHAVIDLKVTQERDVSALIEYMGYKNQLWGYARVAEVPERYILAQRTKKISETKVIPVGEPQLIKLEPLSQHNDFWASKIEDFGRVAA